MRRTIRMGMTKILATLLFSFPLTTDDLSAATVGIVGDSISTGGAAHPALAFDIDRMQAIFSGKQSLELDEATKAYLEGEGLTTPSNAQRLDLSPREYYRPWLWVFHRFITSMSSQYLDSLESSWGSLYGRLGGTTKVFVAARDGEKSQHARQQIDRILDGAQGEALDHLFVFFTGNDICAPHPEFVTDQSRYVANVEEAVQYYIRNAKPKANGELTHIWLVNPLNVNQLVTSQVIQSKKVLAYGKERSCKELQSDQFEKDLLGTPSKEELDKGGLGLRPILAQVFQGGTYGLCPSLFQYHEGSSLEALKPVSDALGGYRQGLSDLAKKLNEVNPSFRVQNLASSTPIEFAAEDIANDCFHLTARGQLKIARALRNEIDQKVKP